VVIGLLVLILFLLKRIGILESDDVELRRKMLLQKMIVVGKWLFVGLS
jgi:hypothetical protein